MSEAVPVKDLTLDERLEDSERTRARLGARISERKRALAEAEQQAVSDALLVEDERATAKASAKLGAIREEIGVLERSLGQANAERRRLDEQRRESAIAEALSAVQALSRRRVAEWKALGEAIDGIAQRYRVLRSLDAEILTAAKGLLEAPLFRTSTGLSFLVPPLHSPERLARCVRRALEAGESGRREVDPTPNFERIDRRLERITREDLARSIR